ncbi:hypothetical protein [Xenorhabdus sp. IM139775]|uniref:hypothetical protein n=1 Tax=Xenorhabdus sp. IM139775 TaxID=3025876 RepID=UPI002358E9A5|nr:hypothetical protein [Xenorhabdus sp. IM139775]MDC9593983.1 hypothetical protein [Xenorhabdus sp. IM139775]
MASLNKLLLARNLRHQYISSACLHSALGYFTILGQLKNEVVGDENHNGKKEIAWKVSDSDWSKMGHCQSEVE